MPNTTVNMSWCLTTFSDDASFHHLVVFNPCVHAQKGMMVALSINAESNESDKNSILKLLICSLDIEVWMFDYLVLILCACCKRGDALKKNLYIWENNWGKSSNPGNMPFPIYAPQNKLSMSGSYLHGASSLCQGSVIFRTVDLVQICSVLNIPPSYYLYSMLLWRRAPVKIKPLS